MSEPKNHIHVQATVGDHGSVTLDRLPYQPGQQVDVRSVRLTSRRQPGPAIRWPE